jgi:hypothetical protein
VMENIENAVGKNEFLMFITERFSPGQKLIALMSMAKSKDRRERNLF